MKRFDYQLDKVIGEIKKRKAKVVLLQFPEGIKQEASDVVKSIEKKTNVSCVVSGETCWGGCDIDINEAKAVKADLIIHFGHAPFIKYNFPIFYVHVDDSKDLLPFAKKSLSKLKSFKNIGLLSSIQHMHMIDQVKKFYQTNDKKVTIPGKKGHGFLGGHVVGCEYGGLKAIKSKIDAVVVIGNQFHALGAALAVPDKPVFMIDTYNNEVVDMETQRKMFITQRAASIAKIEDAKKIGIIVGLKAGQHFGLPGPIKKGLEKMGKQVMVITMREMTTDKIINFYDIDGFVELACPRIAVDDYGKYNKPIITFREAMVVIGKTKWDDLLENGFV